jgi:hypothetical protein
VQTFTVVKLDVFYDAYGRLDLLLEQLAVNKPGFIVSKKDSTCALTSRLPLRLIVRVCPVIWVRSLSITNAMPFLSNIPGLPGDPLIAYILIE